MPNNSCPACKSSLYSVFAPESLIDIANCGTEQYRQIYHAGQRHVEFLHNLCAGAQGASEHELAQEILRNRRAPGLPRNSVTRVSRNLRTRLFTDVFRSSATFLAARISSSSIVKVKFLGTY